MTETITSALKTVENAVIIKSSDHKHWYDAKRWQGISLMILGSALTAVPYIPDTVGMFLLTTGWGWACYGAGGAVERNK